MLNKMSGVCSRLSIGAVIAVVALVVGVSPVGAAEKILRYFAAGLNPYLTQTVFPEFEKKYGVKVVSKAIGWAQQHEQELAIAAAAGMPPDVVEVGANYHITENKFFRPLDEYINKWKDRDQIIRPLWEMKRYQGKIWVVPMSGEARVFAYHVPQFEEAGLDPKRPPQSWQELQVAVRKLTKTEGTTIKRLGLRTDWNELIYRWFVLQAGADVVDDEKRLSFFDSSEARIALEFYVELFETTFPPGFTQALPPNDPYAWAIAHNGHFSNYASVIDTPLGFFAPRKSPTSPPVVLAFVNGLAITRDSKDPDLAWKFIEFLMSRDVQIELTKLGGLSPFRSDVIRAIAEHPEMFPKGVPLTTTATYSLLPQALPGAPGLFTAELRNKINSYLIKARRKEIPVEQAVAEMHRECRLYIESMKKHETK